LRRRSSRTRFPAAKDSLEADLEGLREGLESRDPQALSAAQEKKDAYLAKLTANGTTLAGLRRTLGRAREEEGHAVDRLLRQPPRGSGGCPGTEVTDAMLAQLRADPKLTKAIDKAF
jgi:hypothetical protein